MVLFNDSKLLKRNTVSMSQSVDNDTVIRFLHWLLIAYSF
jgi:hypothetical protein